jgi:hypothetical protein
MEKNKWQSGVIVQKYGLTPLTFNLEQKTEHRILADMPAFPDGRMQHVDGFLGHVRIQRKEEKFIMSLFTVGETLHHFFQLRHAVLQSLNFGVFILCLLLHLPV